MVAEYYRLMRWSPSGVPTPGLLRDLGLEDWLEDHRLGVGAPEALSGGCYEPPAL
jgi:hypothetical protein